jgi:hypothetical protein
MTLGKTASFSALAERGLAINLLVNGITRKMAVSARRVGQTVLKFCSCKYFIRKMNGEVDENLRVDIRGQGTGAIVQNQFVVDELHVDDARRIIG